MSISAVQRVAITSAGQVVASPGAGLRIRVLAWLVVSDGSAIQWQSGGTNLTGSMPSGQIGGSYSAIGHFEATIDGPLTLVATGASSVGGYLSYVIVY